MDIAALTQAIARDFPTLELGQASLIQTRHSAVFELPVAGVPYIFKFPLKAALDWQQEVRLLEFLQGQLPGLIPRPEYIGRSAAYFGYRMLEGDTARGLVQEQYEALASAANADYLADFLQRLHFMTLPDATQLHIRPDPSHDYPIRVAELLKSLPYEAEGLAPFLTKLLARWQYEPKDAPRRLIHNDVHLANMIVATDTSHLVAMVDFGFCALGDPHRDFHQLQKQHPQLLAMVLERYNANSSAAPITLGRIALFAAMDQAAYYAAACTTLAHDVMARAEILENLFELSRSPALRDLL